MLLTKKRHVATISKIRLSQFNKRIPQSKMLELAKQPSLAVISNVSANNFSRLDKGSVCAMIEKLSVT